MAEEKPKLSFKKLEKQMKKQTDREIGDQTRETREGEPRIETESQIQTDESLQFTFFLV